MQENIHLHVHLRSHQWILQIRLLLGLSSFILITCNSLCSQRLHHQPWSASPANPSPDPYLCASLEEKAFQSRAGTHQSLDAILCDLITPGDVELLQQGTTLTDRRKLEEGRWEVAKKKRAVTGLQKKSTAMTENTEWRVHRLEEIFLILS